MPTWHMHAELDEVLGQAEHPAAVRFLNMAHAARGDGWQMHSSC